MCYPGSGYKTLRGPRKEDFTLPDGRACVAYVADSEKKTQTKLDRVRVRWAWTTDGAWIAPDSPRWQFRSPGHGGIDWPAIIRALNAIGYDGPLSVDWHDPGMDREYGAADALRFVKGIDFDPPAHGPKAFRG